MIKSLYRHLIPQRFKYYPHCKSIIQSGVGLEIGGPSEIFEPEGCVPVYADAAIIDNCNFSSNTVWEGSINEGDTFTFDAGKSPGTQYVAEASNLNCINESSYDFVLSSHCIEHLANPLQGLSEWARVLKENGLLVLVLPHKNHTFDHKRPVTSLEHLIQDFDNQTGEDDMTHLEEILKLHDLSQDSAAGDFQSFRERSMKNMENRCLHHHVFDSCLAVEMVNHMKLQILAVEIFRPFHIIITAKKIARDQRADNEKFRGKNGALCKRNW